MAEMIDLIGSQIIIIGGIAFGVFCFIVGLLGIMFCDGEKGH